MFRSLFTRLAATHLLIAVASLFILMILLGGLLQSFFFRERERTLFRYGQELAGLIGHIPGSAREREEVLLRLRTLDRVIDARVWLVSPDGQVLADSMPRRYRELVLSVEPEIMDRIMAGETVVRRGLFRGRFRVPVISVGIPMVAEGRPVGAIFLHSPVLGVRTGLQQVYRLFLIAGVVSVLMAFVLSLMLSRRITRPLKEMSQAAADLAAGDFEQRVRVPSSGDEIALLAESFNNMAARLGNTERLRREFIANVSHELRSPLTTMRGFLQGVLDGTVSPSEREHYLNLAFDETKRLSRLVGDLLDLAALEKGDFNLRLVDVDPIAVVLKVLEKMEPMAREKGVNLTADLPERVEGLLKADPDRLEQILINLLDNAIRFTPEGGSVRVGVHCREGLIEIYVSDTGPGIPPEDIDRIWERFYKVDRARTRGTAGGTGLGLAIARELTERMGGKIGVESTVGQGTTFFVSFPLR